MNGFPLNQSISYGLKSNLSFKSILPLALPSYQVMTGHRFGLYLVGCRNYILKCYSLGLFDRMITVALTAFTFLKFLHFSAAFSVSQGTVCTIFVVHVIFVFLVDTSVPINGSCSSTLYNLSYSELANRCHHSVTQVC